MCGRNNNKMASLTGLTFHKELGMYNYKMSISYIKELTPEDAVSSPEQPLWDTNALLQINIVLVLV